ncbi:nitroreductase [soil metagenome]
MSTPPSGIDAYLAIVSIRVVRDYTSDPISDAVLNRMLQAGRATGSSRNRQDWLFYVVRNPETLNRLADCVFAPDNVRGCQLAIAIVITGKSSFDGGRAAQNMALAAWTDGIGTCPNSARDIDEARRVLGITEDLSIATILSVGYPAEAISPKDNNPEAILSRIDRKPLEEIRRFLD